MVHERLEFGNQKDQKEDAEGLQWRGSLSESFPGYVPAQDVIRRATDPNGRHLAAVV